jgi:hypothetical protein
METKVYLYYIHEHMNDAVIQQLQQKGLISYDPIMKFYYTHSNIPEFEHGLFHCQFQFSGFSFYNNEWVLQVAYGYPGERVIVQRSDGNIVDAVLLEKKGEDHESEYYSFRCIKHNVLSFAERIPPQMMMNTN